MLSEYKQIKPGDVISYRVNNTNKDLWSGRVLKSLVEDPHAYPGYLVVSLEAGYEGQTDWVNAEMVVSFSKNKEGKDLPLV